MAGPNFSPVRACLFDMDGLLINTEDLYTVASDRVLLAHNSGPMTWDIKAQLQGRPVAVSTALLLAHFGLEKTLSVEQYLKELLVAQTELFPTCVALPGVLDLLASLKQSGIKIALATSSTTGAFKLKTAHLPELFGFFPERLRILGDDARIGKGRGKPSPDIYQLALKAVNETLGEGEREITPDECLVFEDAVPGVESGRRAGMRVVWVPTEGLKNLLRGKEEEVLAGRGEKGWETRDGSVGQVGDGWSEERATLEGFNFAKYGIEFGKVER